jgi:effector-binding domain-containing protein
MISTPVIIDREAQHYAAIRTKVAMNKIPDMLPPLIPEVADWLSKNKITPAGPPFFRYLTMNNDMEVEVGIPVPEKIMGDVRVTPGYFPAGRYGKITYMGHYSHIRDAHMALESWSKEKHLKACPGTITEVYITDPQKEPSPEKWQTDIIYQLAE